MTTPTFNLAKAAISFNADTESNWNTVTLPVPADAAIFTHDTKKFKLGDGSHKFHDLASGPTLAGIKAYADNKVVVTTQLNSVDNGHVIAVAGGLFQPNTTKLSDITDHVAAIVAKDNAQDIDLNVATSQFQSVDTSIVNEDTGRMVQASNHRMKPGIFASALTPDAAVSQPITIFDLGVYSDEACKVPVTLFMPNCNYFIKVSAAHDSVDVDLLTFTLTDGNFYTSTVDLGRGLFKIIVDESPVNDTIVFTATVSYGGESSAKVVSVALVGFAAQDVSVNSIGIYTNLGCTIPAAFLASNHSYYAKIVATFGNLDITRINFGLTDTNEYTTITEIGLGVFKIDVAEPPVDDTVMFAATAGYGLSSSNSSITVPIQGFAHVLGVTGIGIFSNLGCTIPVTQFVADSSYYAKISATFVNLTINDIIFTLSDLNTYTTITPVGLGIFKIDVAEPPANDIITLTGTAAYGVSSTTNSTNVPILQYVPAMSVTSIDIFIDADCTIGATQFAADSIYYAKVNATYGNLSLNQISFTLTDNCNDTTINAVSDNVFKITVGEPATAATDILTGTASYSTASANNTKTVSVLQYIPTLHINGVGLYTNALCTIIATQFVADSTYYAKIDASFGNLNLGNIIFGLTDTNSYTTITPIGNGIFKIDVAEAAADATVTLNASITYSTASDTATKNVPLLQYVPTMAITNIGMFSDAGCQIPATTFAADSTYYAKISATFGNLDISQVTFALSDTNPYTNITHIFNGIFRVDVLEPLDVNYVTLNGSVSYSTASATGTTSITLAQYVPVIGISSFQMYSDAGCTNVATSFAADSTYYAKLLTTHGNLTDAQLTYSLTDNSIYTTITEIGLGVFKIDVAEPLNAGTNVTLSYGASYSTASASGSASVPLEQYVPVITVGSVTIFTDAGCTIAATQFVADTDYYAKVNASYGNLNASQIAFGMTSSHIKAVVSPVSGNVFKIAVGEPTTTGSTTLTGTASYSSASASNTKSVPVIQYVPAVAVTSVSIFTDAGCTTAATQFLANSIYYAKVNATYGNLTIGQVAFGLSSNNAYAVVAAVSDNVFKITVGEPNIDYTVVLTGTASYSTANGSNTKNVSMLQYVPAMSVTSIGIYTDLACTITATQIDSDTTYYGKVNATYGNLNINQIIFGLTNNNAYVEMKTNYGDGKFSFYVWESPIASTVVFTGTASYSTASASNTKNIQLLQYIPALAITSVKAYSDAACLNQVTKLDWNSTYYIKTLATSGNITSDKLTFTLTTGDTYITSIISTGFGVGVSKITLGEQPDGTNAVLTAGVAYVTASTTSAISVPIHASFLNNIYAGRIGSANQEVVVGVQVDANRNIFIIARSDSDTGFPVSSNPVMVLMKYDSNFNLLLRKDIGWTTAGNSNVASAMDSNGNLFISGSTYSGNTNFATVWKYDTNLNRVASRYYYYADFAATVFLGITVDKNNRVIAAGYWLTTAGAYGGLLCLFNNDLTEIAQRTHSVPNYYTIFFDVKTDSSNNIIIVGYSNCVAAIASGIILKVDSNLQMLNQYIQPATNTAILRSVAIDSNNNVFAVGYTSEVGVGNGDMFVWKFNSSMILVANKVFGVANENDQAYYVAVDGVGHIHIVGSGGGAAAYLKLTNDINTILVNKRFGTTTGTAFTHVKVDSFDNVYISGYETDASLGQMDGVLFKIPKASAGLTFSCPKMGNLSFGDYAFTKLSPTIGFNASPQTWLGCGFLSGTDASPSTYDSGLYYNFDLIVE